MGKSIEVNGIKFKSATVDWEDASSALSLPTDYITPEGIKTLPPVQHAKGYVAKIGKYIVVINQICGTDADCTLIPLKPHVKIKLDK